VENLSLTVADRTLLEKVDFSILRGEKCAVVGDNGTGKSTLLKEIIRGKNEAIKLGRFVKIACYDQENANLNPENEVLYELWGRHNLWEQTKVRKILAQAGLGAEDMEKKVKSLSGGERAKLALAVFECEGGNFLLLDEPTNHLDLQARESLEQALKDFDGTVLFVSHDRYFIQALAGKVLELADGKATEFKGTFEEYNAFKLEQKTVKTTEKTIEIRTPAPTLSTSYRTKEERAIETKKRLRIKEIETKIGQLEEEETEINTALATPEVSGNFALLTEKCNRLEVIKAELDKLYEEYETLI
jgi:ATP-binding cassette subfamily F protein 3